MSDSSLAPKIYVTQLNVTDLVLVEKLKKDLAVSGFELGSIPYAIFSAKKKGIVCTLYQSGKLTVQGKEMKAFIEFYLEPEILKTLDYSYHHLKLDQTARIGIDESGKGDFFGPLCVAGVFAQGQEIIKLKELGVKDSKTLSDTTIVTIGQRIKQCVHHHIIKITPKKYNELYQKFGNLNSLLAWGHATAIEKLVESTGCRNVIIDQFANEWVVTTALKRKKLQTELSQRHRGEEDIVVAAASILARLTFLEGISALEKEFGLKLPKGASSATIQAGRAFVNKFGSGQLNQVCKLHFKTLESVLKA